MSLIKLFKEFTQEFYNHMRQMNMELVDTAEIGDHELAILNDEGSELFTGVRYNLAFHRKGKDSLNRFQHKEKFTPERIKFTDLKKIIIQLKKWINKYERLLVGSENPEKVETYKKVFDRGGINYEETYFDGQKLLILKK